MKYSFKQLCFYIVFSQINEIWEKCVGCPSDGRDSHSWKKANYSKVVIFSCSCGKQGRSLRHGGKGSLTSPSTFHVGIKYGRGELLQCRVFQWGNFIVDFCGKGAWALEPTPSCVTGRKCPDLTHPNTVNCFSKVGSGHDLSQNNFRRDRFGSRSRVLENFWI